MNKKQMEKEWDERTGSGDGIEERLYYQSLLGVYVHSSLNKLDQKDDYRSMALNHTPC